MVWMQDIPEREDLERIVEREHGYGRRVWVIVSKNDDPVPPAWVLELADKVTRFLPDGSKVDIKDDTHYETSRKHARTTIRGVCTDWEIDLPTSDRERIVHAFALAMAEKAAEIDRLRDALADAINWHETERANEACESPRVDGWRQSLMVGRTAPDPEAGTDEVPFDGLSR